MPDLAHARDRNLEDRLGSFDRRTQRRKSIRLDGFAFSSPSRQSTVKVLDISTTGCRLRDRKSKFAKGECLTFTLDGETIVEGIIRWWKDYDCGVEFLAPLPASLFKQVA